MGTDMPFAHAAPDSVLSVTSGHSVFRVTLMWNCVEPTAPLPCSDCAVVVDFVGGFGPLWSVVRVLFSHVAVFLGVFLVAVRFRSSILLGSRPSQVRRKFRHAYKDHSQLSLKFAREFVTFVKFLQSFNVTSKLFGRQGSSAETQKKYMKEKERPMEREGERE